jgi:hypothetical protein
MPVRAQRASAEPAHSLGSEVGEQMPRAAARKATPKHNGTPRPHSLPWTSPAAARNMTTSHPAAHALFRIEEEQAKRTVEEKVIELGLRIPLVKIREPKESFFSRKLLSSSGAAAPRSSPDSNRACTSAASLALPARAHPPPPPPPPARPTTATNLTNHSAMIKVFTAQPVTVPELRTLSPEDYEEVYQSEVQTGPSPVFATLLLLPLEREDGFAGAQGTVRPIRFELWIGASVAGGEER